jgi:hypothetical protein
LAVVGSANVTAEQYESAVTLATAEHLPCMPRERCSIKGNEYKTSLRTGDQQRGIVKAEP